MRVTVRLDDALAEHVDAVRQDSETADAEAVRQCLRRSQNVDELEKEIAELQTDVERLQNEKQQILEQREEHSQLVRAVDRQRTLEEQKAEAGVATRAKWYLFGMPGD